MNLTDFAPDAHRLAMELECLLLDCTDTRVVSKWWDSANEALDQHRAFCATIEAEATKPCICGEPATPGVVHRTDGPCYLQEATKPQGPIGYDDIFNAIAEAASPCGEGIGVSVMAFKRVIGGEIYTTPQHCPKCAEGMVSVAKEDANNYCRILTLLGMEEEGSPVEAVERLISLRDGMTCGDCNDTGWLENREEGRYPCTCMTEAEPYQLLQAKCAELEHQVSEGHKNTLRLESVIRDFEAQTKELETSRPICSTCACEIDKASGVDVAKLNNQIKEVEAGLAQLDGVKQISVRDTLAFRAERDALAITVQQMREALESIYDGPDPIASYHHGIRCGVEDQMIEDKYEAAEYGYDDALQYCAHIAKQALALPSHAEIIKRHDADKKDAERYRWLRDESNQTSEDSPCVSDASWGTFFGESLDATIDAELEAK